MQYPVTVQILFECALSRTTSAKKKQLLQRKTSASCIHKSINGFFLEHRDTFVGVFEGPTGKVMAQIETLVRKDFVIGVSVVQERKVETCDWTEWFDDGRHLSDLPPEVIAQMAGLAQFIVHKLNAEPE